MVYSISCSCHQQVIIVIIFFLSLLFHNAYEIKHITNYKICVQFGKHGITLFAAQLIV